MNDRIKSIKRTNKALAAATFEGSPLGTVAGLIQQTKEDFDHMIAKIKVTLIEFLLLPRGKRLQDLITRRFRVGKNGELSLDQFMLEANGSKSINHAFEKIKKKSLFPSMKP